MVDEVKIDHGEWYINELGDYCFRVVGGNNEIISWGESYLDKADCLAALRALCPEPIPIIQGYVDRASGAFD